MLSRGISFGHQCQSAGPLTKGTTSNNQNVVDKTCEGSGVTYQEEIDPIFVASMISCITSWNDLPVSISLVLGLYPVSGISDQIRVVFGDNGHASGTRESAGDT